MTNPNNITFGILTDYVADYHRQIIRGIQMTLGQAGHSSVVFIGTDLNQRNLPEMGEDSTGANTAYDLISPHLSGVIALAGSMGPTLNDNDLLGFFARFAPLPLVSVGRVLSGIPSVVSQHPSGMRDLMRHLIEGCGHRRLAFMRGFPGEPDSDAREQVFRDALIEHNLELREQDVLTGEYFSNKAYEAARDWLRGNTPAEMFAEVIVCANDDMAFGVLQALEEAGLNVPEDMAVSGFDDLEQSRHNLPSLTTVRQPMFELGVQAAQRMLEQIHGLSSQAVTDLPSALMVRESTQKLRTSSHALEAVPSEDPPGLETLREQFTRSVQQPAETGQSFLRAWRTWMRSDPIQNQGPRLWQDVLQRLLTEMPTETSASLEPQTSKKALTLWGRAQAMTVSEGQVLQQRYRLYQQTGMSWFHNYGFDIALMSDANIPALIRNIARFLPELGLNRCYVALFETFGPSICDTAHLVLSFGHGQVMPLDATPFPSRNLMPASMQDHLNEHLHLQPIYVNDQQYGWMMVETSDQIGFYFEALHQTLCSGIHNVVQAKRLQDYTGILETRISERTQALETSNDQLRAENAERRLTQDPLRAANAQLRQATLQDGLTGVSNRAALDDHLERQLRSGQRHQQPLTFVLCDIDYFKNYNDHYGHLAGDRTLRDVAQTIHKSLLRSEDMVARYGGEEFALVLPDTNLEDAQHVIERIQRNLANLNIAHKTSSTAARLTLSMGAISLLPDESCGILELIHTADLGLYEAKAAGRNTVIWQTALRQNPIESRSEFALEPGV